MALDTVIESVSGASIFQQMRAIDEKHGIRNIVLLAELGQELLCKNAVCRRLKLCM